MRRELDRIIRDELSDPRIGGTWSIVRARFCKARVSVLEEDKRAPMMAALKSAAGFIRRELGRGVDLRYTPEVLFELDTNIEYADRIGRILKETSHEGENDGDI